MTPSQAREIGTTIGIIIAIPILLAQAAYHYSMGLSKEWENHVNQLLKEQKERSQ